MMLGIGGNRRVAGRCGLSGTWSAHDWFEGLWLICNRKTIQWYEGQRSKAQ